MARIYVAEDSKMQALLVKQALAADHEVTLFEDGLDVYLAALKDPPDVLLLDIILPRLIGLAVCRLLKYSAPTRQLPVLMMSSITDADIRQRVERVGAQAYLRKPFEAQALRAEVSRLLV